MSTLNPVERVLRRERAIVLCALSLATVLAWIYLIFLSRQMEMGESLSDLLRIKPWRVTEPVMTFLMWSVMMVGMMLPSATPMILLYQRVLRKNLATSNPYAATEAFLAGYIAIWILFSMLATVAQWGLEQQALLSPMMVSASPALSGLILIVAGIYQRSSVKSVCLNNCRSPVSFLANHWRNGVGGAFHMGLEHGFYCLGCCWAWMTLLFVGGVMNLLWVAAITIVVLLEKGIPHGPGIGRATAPILVLIGILIIVTAG